MQIKRKNDIIHLKPQSKDSDDYAFALSAEVFHTQQLFLYSEKVEPGKKSSSPHFHKSIDEIVMVTKGELYAYEEDQEVLLKAGDAICFSANSKKKHYLENKSSEISEFLLFRKAIKQNDVVY